MHPDLFFKAVSSRKVLCASKIACWRVAMKSVSITVFLCVVEQSKPKTYSKLCYDEHGAVVGRRILEIAFKRPDDRK